VGREGADLTAACFRAAAARKPLPVAAAMMVVDMADAPFEVAVEQGPGSPGMWRAAGSG
jgi:hypothetical protein